MKTSFWSIAALSFALSAPFSNQYSQEKKAKGIIIYRASQYDKDEVAISKEYLDVRFNSVVINVTGMDGRGFNIQRDLYVTNIAYQDFAFATLRYPQQIDPFMEKGRQMIEASKKYPSAKEVLAPHLEEMKGVANKLNQGIYLVRGQWSEPSTEGGEMGKLSPELEVPSNGDKRTIQTTNGRSFEIREIKSYLGDKILVYHTNGITELELETLTEESQLLLNQDAEFIALKEEAEAKAAQMEEDRIAKQRAEATKAIDELMTLKGEWKDAILADDAPERVKKLAQLVENKEARFSDWKSAIFGSFDAGPVCTFSSLTELVGKPDTADKTEYGSKAYNATGAYRCRYFNAYKNDITGRLESITIIAIPELDAVMALSGDSEDASESGFNKVFVPYQRYYKSLLQLAEAFNQLDEEMINEMGVEIPLLLHADPDFFDTEYALFANENGLVLNNIRLRLEIYKGLKDKLKALEDKVTGAEGTTEN